MDEHIGVRPRRSVFQLEMEGFPAIQEQTTQTDGVLMSLTPIINSMRLFGLYFTRKRPTIRETATGQTFKRRLILKNFSKFLYVL